MLKFRLLLTQSFRRIASSFITGTGAQVALLSAAADLLGIIPTTSGVGSVQRAGIITGVVLFCIGMIGYARTHGIITFPTSRPDRRTFLPLVALILLAAFLRFFQLDRDSLWVDELASWLRTTHPTMFDALMEGHIDSMWPGYHIPLYFITRVLGQSEFALRIPSVLFGVLHIPLIYQIGRRLYSHKEGLIAALFMTVLLNPIAYSQEARSYSMLLFFTLLATYIWIGWLQVLHRTGNTPPGAPLRYIVTAVMVIYLQWFGLLVIVLQGAGALIFGLWKKRGLAALTSIYIVIVLAIMPLLTTFGGTVGIDNTWIPRSKGIGWAITRYFAFAFNDSLLLGYIVIGIWGAAGVLALVRRRDGDTRTQLFFPPTWMLVLWLIWPLMAVYVFSIVVKPVWIGRYLMVTLPATYLLLARAITRFPLGQKLAQAAPLFLAAGALYYVLMVNGYYYWPQKEQFREAVHYMLERDASYENSLIITHTGGPKEYMDYYFYRAGAARTPDFDGGSRRAIALVEEASGRGEVRYVWYITAHYRPQEAFVEFMDGSFHLLESESYWHATVRLYEIAAPQEAR